MSYYVYLLASGRHGTLYLGMTNDLVHRVWEHKNKLVPGFSATYGVDRLVWHETHDDVTAAITREKKIKKNGGATGRLRLSRLTIPIGRISSTTFPPSQSWVGC
jgi:putative endonuclease